MKANIPEWIKRAMRNHRRRAKRYMKKHGVSYEKAVNETGFEWSYEDDRKMFEEELNRK